METPVPSRSAPIRIGHGCVWGIAVQRPMDELGELRAQVRLLEERVRSLRSSRRVLMNLLAAQEREKRARITRLETENTKLQRQSARWATALLDRNIRIVRMQDSQNLV